MQRLRDELHDLSISLDRTYRELQAVLTLTREVNEGVLLEEVLERLYVSLQGLLPYERIGCALLENDQTVLRARWARTEAQQVGIYKGFAAPMAGSSLEPLIASGSARILNDLEQYLEEHPRSASTRAIVAEGMRSSLTCPLIARGRAIGFLFFSSVRPFNFEDAHVEAFQALAGQIATIVEKSTLYEEVLRAREQAEQLLRNILPGPVVDRMNAGETRIADHYADVTVVFADLVGFTRWAATLSPQTLVQALDQVFSRFDALCDRFGVEKIKTIGDAYMAVAGAPVQRDDHALAALRLAHGMVAEIKAVSAELGYDLNIRVGLASGPVVAGVIGRRRFAWDIWGDTVNLASRMESHGLPGRIHLAASTAAALQGLVVLEPRGTLEIKGKGGCETFLAELAPSALGSTQS